MKRYIQCSACGGGINLTEEQENNKDMRMKLYSEHYQNCINPKRNIKL